MTAIDLSATRSHRGGQGFKFPQLHREVAGQSLVLSYQGVPVEEIARLAGHASLRTTEVIYRRELRPVITTGAEVMDQLFQPRQRRGAAAGAAG